MQQQDSSTFVHSLESAIDRRPLTVSPDTPVREVIAIMSKAQSSCVLPSLGLSLNTVLQSLARASAILVVEGGRLLGVFALAEALEAIACGCDLAEVKIDEVMKRSPIALTLSKNQDIFAALSLLQQHQISHLPVVDEQEQLVGMITPASIRQVLQLDELLKSRQLAEVISSPVIQAPATSEMLSLAQLMVKHQVDCVVITEERGRGGDGEMGMIAARDIIQLQALELDLSQIQAKTLMGTPLLCLSPSESVLTAYWEMQQQRVQQLVVSENCGELLGIVTPTSFVQTLDLTAMRNIVEQIQQSIEQFAAETADLPHSHTAVEPMVLDNRAELLEQLQCSRLLTAMALHIRESLNLDKILQTAVDDVRQFLQTDRVLIYRFNPDFSGTVVVESVAAGWRSALNSTIQDTCFGQNYAQAYKQGRTQVTEDIYTAGLSQCHIDILVLFDVRASLVVPILQGKDLWGLLCAYHCRAPRRWRHFEVDLLQQLATHIAIAIQQSELYQQVQSELADRKRAEEQLKVSLKEKEVLIKEIHHRVKNNLQVISSVLRLQSDYVKDEQVLALFKDSQNRIRAMALIHEKLYQSKELLRINFAEYIRDLTATLLRSYAASSQYIALTTSADNIYLNIDTVIPCSLIINELVANSLKHAFPPGRKENEIHITVCSINQKQFALSVSDNGIGFPSELDFRHTKSLGLELVCIFTEQLEGNIEIDTSHGTKFTILFAELGS